MVAHLLCAVLADPARDAIRDTLDYYRKLDRFQMTIRHNDSSGLFPGEYVQTLRWRKGGRFELVVTKPVAKGETTKAPNYYSNGKEVTTVWPDGRRSAEEVAPRPNTSPGWEVTGGLVLSALQNSPMEKILLNPPAGFDIKYAFGSETTWNGQAVRTVVSTVAQGELKQSVNLYLAKDAPRLLGMTMVRAGKEIGARYEDQKENPELPDSLGKPPR